MPPQPLLPPGIPGGAIVPYQPPTITPYRPPGSLAKIPAPSPGGKLAKVGQAIAGSFRGAGATRLGRGLGFVGRRLPYIGWAFFAFDAFLIGCAAGLLPLSICPRPDNPSPGGTTADFSGGQCACVLYNLDVYFVYDGDLSPGDQLFAGTQNVQAFGEIRGSRLIQLSNNPDGSTRTRIEILCRGLNGELCSNSLVWRMAVDSVTNYRSHKLINRGRVDGQIDNCGNPQPQPQPRDLPDIINNFHKHNTNINININLPKLLSPSPFPRRSPIILNPPSPLPDIIEVSGNNYSDGGNGDLDINLDYYFSPNPSGNFINQPDIYNNFPPTPQPRFNNPDPFTRQNPPPPPPPILITAPQLPPPLPDQLPPDATAPDIYQFRQNREILDKLYRVNGEILEIQNTLERQNRILENLQRLLDVEVQGSQIIRRCDDIDFIYSYKDKFLPAINKQLDHLKSIDQIIIDEICEVEKESVLASPDWWQVRLKGDTPQLALIFRVGKTRTYHKLTVPHPFNTNKLLVPPIPSYAKGNWQGEIVCIDNSKFLCNCATKEEAERLIQIAITLIDPVFLGNPVRAYFAERKGIAVGPGDMIATSALYFPFGQQQTKPAWRAVFTKFGI